MTKQHSILLVGANGLTGRDFQERYGDQYHVHTLTKEQHLDDMPDQVDAVIFAAQSADYKQPVFTDNLMDVNVRLLHQVASRYAGKAGKFIYFSTGSVYQNDGSALRESSPLHLHSGNPYIASKLMGEELIATFASQYNTLITLRPFFIYGKHQSPQMLMKTMFQRVKEGQPVTLSGSKGLIFNPVHVSDVSDMLHHLLSADDISGTHTFNVAGPETTNLHEAVLEMAKLAGTEVHPEIQGDRDTTLISEVNIPGWKPKTGIKEGLAKTFGS